MALGRCGAQIGLLSCPKAGQGWQWVFEIGRQIFRPRVDVRQAGSHGIRASLRLRGGETASDDVPPASDLPVPIATVAVQGNVVSKCGLLSLGFDDTSPRAGIFIPIPRVARREVNEVKGQACVQNCSSTQIFCDQNCSPWSLYCLWFFVQHGIQQGRVDL